ncbi:phage tail protein [Agrobacterium rosae]
MALFTSAGIASLLSTTAGFFTAATAFVLNTAVGLGISLLGQALAGKQTPASQNFAINGTIQGGGDLARSFIMGRYATAGSLVWVNTWGKDGETPNAYLTQIIALSDLPIAGLDEFWVNGEKVELGSTVTTLGLEAQGTYSGSLWVSFHDGRQTVADMGISTSATNATRSWAATRVGKGVAYVAVTARVSANKFSGVPSFKFVVRGMPLYDPSRDSSVGGSGTQRFSDPSTWGGDGDNLPAVQLYNILRGIYYDGAWFYGLQNLPSSRLPVANWIGQINKHRATIMGASGLEPMYRSAGEISVDAPIASAVEAILTACQGKIAEVGGVYTLHSGAPQGPVISFTDDDILSTEEQEFTPFLGLSDTINGVSATYPSPSDGWVTKTAPPLFRPDFELQDGNRRLMADVPLDFVPYAEQVQRLMKSALEEARRFRRHTLVLPPKFWAYATPGEVFEWTSERNGYVSKLMRIDGVADRANLDVMIDITEVDPADYNWSTGSDFKPPVNGAVGVIRPQPQVIIDWYAEPWILVDRTGEARRPSIKLTWDNSQGVLDDVIGIEYEVRLQSTLEKVNEGRTDQPGAGSLVTSQGLLPDEDYGIRGRYIPRGERETLWSGFLVVRTPNIKLGNKDVDVVADLTHLGQDAKDVFAKLGGQVREFFQKLETIGQAVTLEGAVSQVERDVMRVDVGNAFAEIESVKKVSATADEALAQQITTVTAGVGDNAARITAEETARATGDSANASLITALTTTVNGNTSAIANEVTARTNADGSLATQINGVSATFNGMFADGLVMFQAVAAPAGVSVRFSIMLRASLSDAFIQSGMYIQIRTVSGVLKSEIGFLADKFVVVDGANTYSVFAIEGGQVKIVNAKISQAQIDNLVVGTINIAPGAITSYFVQTGANHGAGGNSFNLTVNHGLGSPMVKLEWKANYNGASGTSGSSLVRNSTDSSTVESVTLVNEATYFSSTVFTPPADRFSTVFEMTTTSTNGTVSNRFLIAYVFKR